MARPIKKYAEFFFHYSRDRHDLRIKALEKRMRHSGYAIHFRLMEFLTGCDSYQIDYTLPHVRDSLPDELMCTEDEFSTYLSHAVELGLIIEENGTLYSPDLLERLQPLERTRELDRRRKSLRNDPLSNSFPGGKPPENPRKTPSKAEQSKAEQSKEKKSTAKNGNGSPALFSSENALPKNTRELLTAPPFELTPEQAAGLQDKYEDHYLREHIESVLWRMKQPKYNIKNPAAYLLDRLEKNYPKPGGLIEEEKARRIKQQQEGEMKQREQEAQKVENELKAEKEESARLMQFLEQSPPDVKKLINGWVYKRAQTEEPRLMEYEEVILNYQDEADLEKIDPKYRMTLKVFIKEAVKEYLNQQDSPPMKDES